MAGLREAHKQRRRRAILDAARELLRAGGPDALVVETLAARAEVAPATVYNLIGPRERLFGALLDDLLDELAARLAPLEPADPLARARAIVVESVRLFTADPPVSRAVVTRLGPALHSRPAALQARAFHDARAAGLLHPAADPEALGAQVLLSTTGALLLWAAGHADDARLADLALAGLDLALAAAVADPAARAEHLAAVATSCNPVGTGAPTT